MIQLDFPRDAPAGLANARRMPTTKIRVTSAQYQMLADFRHSLRQFLRYSEHAAQAAGVTAQQHQALLAIKGHRGGERMSVGELAESLQIRHHSAVGLVDRLVDERCVRRITASGDRRRVHLALTVRGEAILEKLTAAHREQLRRIGPQIKTLLERLRGADGSGAR
jgi:DNA-binding MarR family transcriptional regulator